MVILGSNRKRWPLLVASSALIVAAACSDDDDAGLDTVESSDTSSATDDADTSTGGEVADVDGDTEGGEAPSSAPPDGPLATVEGSSPYTGLEITDLRRVGDSVTLEFVITVETDSFSGQNVSDVFSAPEDQYGADGVGPGPEDADRRTSVSGVTLVDEANRNQHLVLRNEEGICLCTSFEGIANADAGRHVHSAQFPAPPEDVQDMTVQVPLFPAVDSVPLRTAG